MFLWWSGKNCLSLAGTFWFICRVHQTLHLQISIYFGLYKILFFIIIFNWRIIALQCCVGFCHTSICISHRYIRVSSSPHLAWISLPPLTPYHPLRLSQSTWFVLLSSYSTFPVAFCFTYGNVYVSMSLAIHPTLSLPSVHKSVLSVSPLLPWK